MNVMSMPQDALRRSFSYLNAKELASLSMTNKFFLALSEEIVQDILKEIHTTLFPILFKPLAFQKSANVNMKRLLHRLTTTQIYTLGGAFNSDSVNCYLPRNNEWHMAADMKRERERSSVTSVRGYMVTLSGESDDSISSVELFSPLENAWAAMPSLPLKVRSTSCVSMNDKIVVVGGQNATDETLQSSVQVFDMNFSSNSSLESLRSSSWKTFDNILLQPRSGHSVAVYNGEIWVAGGCTDNESYSQSVETICYKNGAFTAGRAMPSLNNGRKHLKLLVVKGKLYAVGGDNEGSIEFYNEDTEEWEIITNFPVYKTNFAATTDGENIFVFGGQDRRRSFLTTWECFNVSCEKWTVSKARIPSYDGAGFAHGNAITMDFENIKW